MSFETQAPDWAWYFVALYFFIGGTAAGAYFIGSLAELFGGKSQREISRIAFYLAFPLILITPFLLIADLGRPERFWHLFVYANGGRPAFNFFSPLSVGSWALLLFGAMAFLSFLDNLIVDGRLKSAPFANLYNRIPRRLYGLVGSLAGFFVAGYTGVLLDLTARPLWAASDPLVGALFVASAGSAGAAAIALVLAWRKTTSNEMAAQLGAFDRIVMIIELVLVVAMIVIAGQFAAPLLSGPYAIMFWGGAVLLGILIPLVLNWTARRPGPASSNLVVLTAILVLFGSALLRISLVQAGQV